MSGDAQPAALRSLWDRLREFVPLRLPLQSPRPPSSPIACMPGAVAGGDELVPVICVRLRDRTNLLRIRGRTRKLRVAGRGYRSSRNGPSSCRCQSATESVNHASQTMSVWMPCPGGVKVTEGREADLVPCLQLLCALCAGRALYSI